MLPASNIVDAALPVLRAGTPAPLLTRAECAAWQRRVEALVAARGQRERMLEVALAAMQYASEGMEADEALGLAADVVLR